MSYIKLNTIQTQRLLNTVVAVGEEGPGGAYHNYEIIDSQDDLLVYSRIHFQEGPRFVATSSAGIMDSDLLEIVRHRLQSFQQGAFRCDYNEQALYHVEQALKALNARVEDRINRKVLGTTEK